MKTQSTLRALLLGASFLVAPYVQAATLYWDGTDSTANADGGAGNWNNALTNWDTLAAAGSSIAWTSGDTAVFTVGAAAATITLTDNITVGGLTFNGRNTFNANSYTLNANGNTLSFASGDNTILFNPSNGVPNATITGQVAGTGANVIVSLANPVYTSTLTFSGASTGGWTGTTTIGAGMTLTSDSTGGVNQVLNNTSAININGGTLRFNRSGITNTNIINDSAAITVNGGGTLFQQNLDAGNANAIETVGAVTVNSGQFNFNINNGGSSGSIVRLGNLTTNGTSAVTFSFNAATNNFWENLNGGIAPANTAANEIIGAWATTGGAGGVAAQTDYAIYTNSNGRIAARGIGATAQSTWTTTHAATSNYTLANASGSAANGLLSATRNINTLRYTTAATAVTATNATDVINLTAHGFVAGDVVSLGGTTAPTGLTLGQVYYVINATANTFQLSTTSGGGAALFTADGAAVNIAGGVTLASGTTLGTFGILNGSTATLAIGGNGGNITLPTTASGNLFITTGSGAISIAAPITDNGAGVLTLVKNGSGGALTLSGNNTFTGGIVVNAGTLRLSGTQSFTGGVTLNGGAFGDSTDGIVGTELNSNSITVNGNSSMFITSGQTIAGAIAINSTGNLLLNGDTATLSGVVSGSGGLSIYSRTGTTVTLTNTANTHTGVILIYGDNNQPNTLAVNSLADSASPGAGTIQLGTVANGGGSFALNTGAVAALILNNRQFDLQGDSNVSPTKLSNNSTQAFTINSNLLASGTSIRTLTLGGSGFGLSTFGGTITNGSLTTLNLTKADANNTWSLTNAANSYNGVTTVTAGTLRFSSIADAGSNSSLGNFATAGATGISLGGGTLQYVGASGVSVNRGFTVTANSTVDINAASTSLTLGASSIGAFTLNVTGVGTGSSLGLGALTLTGAAALNPTGANLTVASISATNLGLTLGGTSSGNTVTGAINTGTGTLTKNTASTWTLDGTNGYTGTTTISAGLLRVNGSLNASSAVTVSAGAIGGTGTVNGSLSLTTNGGINLANGSVGGTAFTVGGTLLSSGAAGLNNLTFDLASGGSTTDQIVASGAFNMTTAGAVVVNVNQLGGSGNRLTAGTYDILTATSGTALSAANGGNFRLATTKAFGQTFSLVNSTSTILKLTTTQVTGAILASTTLSGATPWWTDVSKFSGGALPDYMSNVIINSAIGINDLQESQNINSLTYGTSATTATTIRSGSLTGAGTLSNMLVIEAGNANGNTVGNGITLSNASGTHTISANVGLASTQTWTVGTGAGLTVSGVISDFGGGYGLTKEGGGTLTLSGLNTFSGPLTIANGTVRADISSGALKGTNGLLGAGTTLVMGANGQTGRLAMLVDAFPTIDKDITLATGGTGEFQFGNLGSFNITNTDRTMTFTGNISGSGNFTKLGGSTIVLTGNNTFTGTTTINEGALRLSSATSLPGGIGATGGTSALTINGNGNINVGAVVSLTAASGDFRRALGTGADQFQITGGVSGFEANGSTRQVVVGNDAAFELQWGIATFNPSALLLGYNSVTATGALTLQNKIDLNAATRTIQVATGAATSTISGDIRTSSGTAGLTKTGGGTLALSGSNTYNGTTTVSAGTLQLGNGGTTGSLNTSSSISVSSGASFAVNQTDTVTQGTDFSAAAISGFGGFTQAGTGTTILNVANTYLGPTTISAGTLNANSSAALGSASNFLVFNGGTLQAAGTITSLTTRAVVMTGAGTIDTNSNAVSIAGLISGTGALTKIGAGTLTLSNANTFTGATTVSAGTIAITNALALQNSAYNTTGSNGSTIGLNVTSGLSSGNLTLGGLAGSVDLASAFTAGFTGTVSNLTLNPQTGITSTYGGVIDNGAMSLTKTGAGTQVLTGANLYTGATSINSGTLNLGGGLATGSLASTVLNLGGGTLSYTRTGTNTQTFTTTNITAGANTISNTVAGNTLALGSIVRTLGSTVNFSNSGTITTSNTNTNGILGGWATVANGDNWATYTGSNIAALGVYTVANATAATNLNTNMDAATVTIGGVINTNSIRFSGASVKTLTLAAGDNIIQSGGILVRSDVAANLQTITGGNLLGSSGGDLIIHQYSTGSLTIASLIKDNGTATALTKSGSGTLTLSNASNSYSGGTFLNGGTLAISSDGNLGGASGGITFNGTSTLSIDNGVIIGAGRTLTVNDGASVTFSQGSNGGKGIAGVLTGSGSITWGTVTDIWFSNVANTFNGAINATTTGSTGTAPGGYYGLGMSSIGDAAGAGTINLSGTSVFIWRGKSGTTTLTNRQFNILGSATIVAVGGSGTLLTGGDWVLNPANNLIINKDLLVTNAGAKTLTLAGGNTGANTFAGKIADGAGSVISITKNDAGRWILSGSNTYTGVTTVSGGTLVVSTLADGFSSSNIGASSNAAGNLVLNGGTLRYTGGAVSTDRLFSLQFTGTSTIDSSGTGAINFTNTGAMGFNGGVGAKTLALTGSNTGNNTLAAVIGDNTGATAVTKTSIGTWVLSAANTYTGVTTLQGGGTTVLDYGTSDTSKFSDTVSALVLGGTGVGGGTLTLNGATGSHIEIVTSTSLNAGGTFLTRSGANTAKLRMNVITRAAGGTISFGSATLADTDTVNINSILGGFATLDNDWAVSAASGTDIAVTALASYTTWVNSTGSSTANYLLNGAGSIVTTAVAANTVKITNSANSETLALNNLNLTITSASATSLGGIMYAGGSDNLYSITGGTGRIQTSTVNQELIFAVQTGTLSVGAFVGASGSTGPVTKTGAGTLAISSLNNYTGATYVNQGVLQLRSATAAGTATNTLNAGIIVQNNAALELANSAIIGTEALTITGTGVSNGGALRNVASNTSSYAGAITIGTGGARINSDATGINQLTLSGGVTTSLFNDVTFGGAGNTTVQTVAISGAGGLIKDGAGTTTLATGTTHTYTGATTVSDGTLLVNGSIASSSLTTVASTATIGGSGTVGALTVSAGGFISGGDSGDSTSILNINGAYNQAGQNTADIAGTSFGNFDQLNVTGAVNISGGSLVTMFSGSYSVNNLIFILLNDGADTITGTYAGLAQGATVVNYDGFDWSISYTADSVGNSFTGGNDIALMAIPEPKTALLGCLGVLLLLRRRR